MSLHALVITCLLIRARAAPPADIKPLDDIDLDVLEPQNEIIPDVPAPIAEAPAADADEELQLERLDENSNDYIPDINSAAGQRKGPLDLKNPGPPQRQEHETQNPESFAAQEKSLITIQEKLDQARNLFTEQIKSVHSSFDALIHGSDNLPVIHEQVRNLKSSFAAQIDDLNNTIQSYVHPACENLKSSLKPENEPIKEKLESSLKEVQNNFDNGISAISEGLELITILKEEDEAAMIKGKDDAGTSTTTTLAPATIAQTQGFFQNAFTTFSNLVSNGFSNFQQGLNYLAAGTGQNQGQTPPNVQADAQSPQQQPQRPIVQGIQGISNFFSNILNRPQSPAILQPQANQPSNAVGAQPASAASASPQQQQASPPQPSPQPATQPQAQPQATQPAQVGPIQQLIQNNPIVQRVTSFLRPQPTQPQPTAQPFTQSSQPQAQSQPLSQPAQPLPQPLPLPSPQPAQQPQTQPQPQQSAQPAAQAQSQAAQPQVAQSAAAQPAQAQPGPIQQIVQRNPIIRGLQAAVQRVQNPRPQDPSKPRESDEEKGHGGYGGYGGNYINKGDNHDSGVADQVSEVKNLGQDAVTQEVIQEQEIKGNPITDAEKTE